MTGWHGDTLIVAKIWQNLAKIANNCQKLPKINKKFLKKMQDLSSGVAKKLLKKCQKLPNVAKSCHKLQKGQQVRKSFQKLPRIDKMV